MKYNLQFFGEETTEEETDETTEEATEDTSEVDVSAFADLLSEKDKQIQKLEQDVSELKKSNAQLLVKVSAGARAEEFDFSKAIIDFCDTRKIK